jgi:LPXTG-motif cell wall-anchored protein
MTDPSFPCARRQRWRWAHSLAVAGTLGIALSPVPGSAPAAAVPDAGPCRPQFGSSASAALLNLRTLDVRPLGLRLPALADVNIGSTRAGFGAGPTTAAEGRFVRAAVLGQQVPAPVLDAVVHQEAPPANATPSVVPTPQLDLGAARLGAGTLSAHATWADPARCEPDSGPRATANATLKTAAVLPAAGSLVRVSGLASTTRTEVVRHNGTASPAAVASARLDDVELFAGTPSAVSVKVLSQPSLRVVAGGSAAKSTVEYAAPVFEVRVPGQAPVRLDGQRGRIDIAVPVDASAATLTGDLARTQALPLLPTNLLGGLLGGGHGDEQRPLAGKRTAVLRLSVAGVSKDIADAGLHARATTLRVSLLLCDNAKVNEDAPVLDLTFGVMEAAAGAPRGHRPPGYGGGAGEEPTATPTATPSSPTATPSPSGGGTGSGSGSEGNGGGAGLPVTGSKLLWIAVFGVLLVLVGRGLLVLARRREV